MWLVLAFPQRQRRAPVAGPGQGPVHVVAQPLAVPAMLDVRRVPVGLLVLGQQLILGRGGADVPGRQCVVDQQRVAAPAVRVAVLVRLGPVQQPPVGQLLHQPRIGVLEEHAADDGHAVLELAVQPDRVHHRQPVGPGDLHVVGAEGRGQVDQAGAVLGSHEVPGQHDVRVRDLDQVERALVGGPKQVLTGEAGGDVPVLAEDLRHQGLGQHHTVPSPAPAGPRAST